MFIGRKQELQFLEERYNRSGGQLVVLYGRRRVGKTETLREFCKGKPHVFFSCREVSDQLQLRSFSDRLQSGNIVVIVRVDHNTVSALFDPETRVSDPCDFHISPPGLCGFVAVGFVIVQAQIMNLRIHSSSRTVSVYPPLPLRCVTSIS